MSWPKECKRIVDWSWYNNYGPPLHKPYDVAEFIEDHPEVDGVVLRFCWPSGAKDKHYDGYYDAWMESGKIVMGYGWSNPKGTIADGIEDWKVAMGDRVPRVLISDWEETTEFKKLSKGQLTDRIKGHNPAVAVAFPLCTILNYSRASYLDARVIPGEWVNQLKWWLAHWIYMVDTGEQAANFAELDECLPIDNSFTPNRGKVVRIKEENVKGWQASAKMKIVPFKRGVCDGGYFKPSFLNPIYGGDDDTQPLPAPDLVDVEVRYPASRVNITLTNMEE